MKTTFALFLTFLLYALTFAAADLKPVVDVLGAKLLTGVDYYISPLGIGEGGGLSLASVRNKTCQLDVARDILNIDGLWVRIHPVSIKKGVSGRVIRESTDLIITISSPKIKTCCKSKIWKVDNYDKLRKKEFVTIGGVEADSKSLQSGYFRIEKSYNDYKIVYCPRCKSAAPCAVMCKNVGAYSEQGRILYALTAEPFLLFFKKVRW